MQVEMARNITSLPMRMGGLGLSEDGAKCILGFMDQVMHHFSHPEHSPVFGRVAGVSVPIGPQWVHCSSWDML